MPTGPLRAKHARGRGGEFVVVYFLTFELPMSEVVAAILNLASYFTGTFVHCSIFAGVRRAR